MVFFPLALLASLTTGEVCWGLIGTLQLLAPLTGTQFKVLSLSLLKSS